MDGDVDMHDLGLGKRVLDDEDKDDDEDAGQDVFVRPLLRAFRSPLF
jgi:hypothetical protein